MSIIVYAQGILRTTSNRGTFKATSVGYQRNMVSSERHTLSRDSIQELPQLSIGAKRLLLWCATKPQHVGVFPLLTISVVG